jgi:hypothetical protein
MPEPTQLEIEQAPALKLLADIRRAKMQETADAVQARYPGSADAHGLMQAIIEGRIPNVTFNAV